ncbi:MAG: xanthine dehydrogenase family protein molybdopterin-binding subunit [SAR202 cluster bacterium]|nr:xanthine dehydrogenase family protein molybdopterin-binding subunit [SAR202 cluster bacterium]|tara:strand:- start:11386 stop:13632 length:2247 start_codon:yes stop_codon:yes gene_type:complete
MTERQDRHAVGVPTPRVDGIDKTTGRAIYTSDIKMEGVLFAKTLRSPFPHAKILSIDTSEAERLPGVHAIVTGQDIHQGARHGRAVVDVPVIAQGRVRFVGEQIAAVAADDEDTAQKAIDLIRVEYEEIPAVLNMDEATSSDAPLVHEDMFEINGYPKEISEPSNIYTVFEWSKGDVELGMSQADYVIENTFTTPRQHQGYIEPHSCLVVADESGRVDVWAGNKSPHPGKKMVAVAIGADPEEVVFNPVTIGGDFGGKGSAMNIPIAWMLSVRTGRPVKAVFDYSEDLTSGNPRHASRVKMRTGVKKDGTIVAHEALVQYDSGAYAGFKPGGHLQGASAAAGPYKIPNTKIIEHQIYTNNVPCGFMRGPGEPQAMFAIESQMDCLAEKLGISPVDFRRQNLVTEGDEDSLGTVFEGVRSIETLDSALKASDYMKPLPNDDRFAYGRGVAIGERVQAGGETHAGVTFKADGSVTVHTSVFEQGTGSYTVMQQIVADELRIPIDKVEVAVWDTASTSFDSGIGGARVTRMGSAAVWNAVQAAKHELIKLAADILGWPEEKIELDGSLLTRNDVNESIDWATIVARTGSPIIGLGDVQDSAKNPYTSFTVQVAEVAVDKESGQVKLLAVTTAHDTGTILNPIGHQGQINGGLVQGIGFGLQEELTVEDGRVTTASFADYKMPTIADIPELRTVLLEEGPGGGWGPYQVKGIGEQSNSQTAPAIANAVANAVGIRVRDLPVTAEKIYKALQS